MLSSLYNWIISFHLGWRRGSKIEGVKEKTCLKTLCQGKILCFKRGKRATLLVWCKHIYRHKEFIIYLFLDNWLAEHKEDIHEMR